MDRVTTMWDHRRTQGMQSRCVPCMVVRRWIHRDRTHQGMIHRPTGHPPEGQVVRLLMILDGRADLVRIVPSHRIDPRDTAYQRVLKFGTSKVPKLTKTTLVNTEVHHLIQYIHQLLRHEAFDDSVLGYIALMMPRVI